MHTRLIAISLFFFTCNLVIGSDWPEYLGPNRNAQTGNIPNKILKEPKILWRKEAFQGYSSAIIVKDHCYLYSRNNDQEYLTKTEFQTGKPIWQKAFQASFTDDFGKGNGPRSTPCHHFGKVILLSPDGILRAFEEETGTLSWELNLLEKYEGNKGFFGVGTSPVATAKKLFVMAGGRKAGIICLDIVSGKEIWKSEPFAASYASPVIQDKLLHVIQRQGLSVLDLETGKTNVFQPFKARYEASVNAANPVIFDDYLFLSASYGTGGMLLKRSSNNLAKIWANDSGISSHFMTPVFHDGVIYGYHGRQESGSQLKAIEALTGKTYWEIEEHGAGHLLASPENLVALSENGMLRVYSFGKSKPSPILEKKVFNGVCRTPLAFSGKNLLTRDSKEWICFQLWE
jgi:outer membrane protein assembly factor BamB